MLRTKQIGTLSQCTRSFFLASSRCGSADGSSCTEDETGVSRRSSKGTDSLFNQTTSTSVSSVAAKAGSSSFKDVIKTGSHHPSKGHGYQGTVAHVQPSKSSAISDSRHPLNVEVGSPSEVDGTVQHLARSPKLVAEQFIKTGIATVGVLSDFVNNRLPAADGSSLLGTQTCMVNSVLPESRSKSSNGRSNQWVNKKGQPGPSANADGSNYNSAVQNDNLNCRTEGSGAHKAKQSISRTKLGATKGAQDQRLVISVRANGHSNSYTPDKVPDGWSSEKKVVSLASDSTSYVHKSQRTAKSMKRRGATPSARSSVNASNPVEIFIKTLRQLNWGLAAEEALGNLHCRLDPFQANQVLKQLQDHSVALGFFNWLKCQPGFKHDNHTYTTMVGILGRARQFGSVRRLLEEMVRDGCQPNVVTYNRVIHGYGRANHIDEAMRVFYRMQDVGCEPDHVTFCTLIDIHAKAGYLEVAMDLYQKMLEAGLSPDTFTYSVMINCLGKAGQLPAAYKLFCEMVEHGCAPNLVTYNIMIALQAKARNYPSALKLYRSMREAGFQPDKVTYSIVMEVLGHCGHLDEMEAVFMEMKQDCVPDEPVYGLLVDMWGKAGIVDKARAWYQSMLDAGLRPNVPTCNSLLSAFLRVNRFSDAYNVLQNMLGLGLHPSLQTYTLLLSSCTETRVHMGSCCELMAITGHPAHAFLSSLPAAEPGGQNVREHASAFLDLMHSEDRESKRGLVDAVIDFLHKSGLKEEAGSVWEVASQRNVYPDAIRKKSSDYWLINLHVMSDGTAVIALSRTLAWIRRQMLASGVGPDRIDIITGWGRRSRVTGSSMVRQAVSDLLHLFGSPFYTENRNSGCFVGYGGPLHSWLLHSSVERMHLL